MIRHFDNTAGASKKLIPQFKSPYKIIKYLRHDCYIVDDDDGYQNTQRPHREVWQICDSGEILINSSLLLYIFVDSLYCI